MVGLASVNIASCSRRRLSPSARSLAPASAVLFCPMACTRTWCAMDYSLRRWPALTLFLGDAQVPIDNNWVENQIRSVALDRKNWLFAGSLRAGQRAAAVMSLIQSAKLNGHDPHA